MSQIAVHSVRRPVDRQSAVFGAVFALLVNSGLLGTIYLLHQANRVVRPGTQTFVSAQLVRFGKPRDLSFLPHVQATPKVHEQKKLKLTQDPDSKPTPKPPEPEKDDPTKLDKLADQVKNLRDDDDDRATKEAAAEGDPKGVRGGTAQEASGDPYIIALTAAITERWTVPNLLTPGELSKLKAVACLTIDDDGKLTEFHLQESKKSGNDLFDGSLVATLGSIQTLPKPFGRYAEAAHRGTLCAEFAKQ